MEHKAYTVTLEATAAVTIIASSQSMARSMALNMTIDERLTVIVSERDVKIGEIK